MYLTRLSLNPRRRGARGLLASPHAMHAAVVSGFAPEQGLVADDSTGRVLWRVDVDGHDTRLFVVSPLEPDLTHVVEQAGWPTTSSWLTRKYQPLLDQLSVGQLWAFRLRGNTVKQARDVGKRVGHVTAEQQVEWLMTRAGRHGFVVRELPDGTPEVVVSRRENSRFHRGDDVVTLATAQFDGVLEVVDVESMRLALIGGIGRAKGYGCGLLTLARPS